MPDGSQSCSGTTSQALRLLRATFPTAAKVGDLIVVDIGRNKYRLITVVHFNRRKVYISHGLTRPE
jgi:mRNA interferase HigB